MANALNLELWNLALFVIVLLLTITGGIKAARSGKLRALRRIPAVGAIEEAIGRATELGRPVFYIAGVRDLDDVQTMAGLSILSSVAEMTARYDCELVMPTDRSMVLSVGREICRQAYAAAGRADAYRDDIVSYVSDEQFAFAAKVDGMIERQKPAACLLLGSFYAESLLLAESGHHAGAMQIAGTAGWHQLPFLVAACDYVLIGEELFAASAYLTREPSLLGSLRGQDFCKYLAIALLSGGALLSSLAAVTGWPLFTALQKALLRLLKAG
jgi:hypothetical protein